jgi:hypothetical protein
MAGEREAEEGASQDLSIGQARETQNASVFKHAGRLWHR